jgi:hypothetical protein
VFSPLIGMAVVKCVPDPVEDLVVEGQATKKSTEFIFEHLLANIRFIAFPFVAGAVVVDVTLLLDLPNHRVAAVTAGDQA